MAKYIHLSNRAAVFIGLYFLIAPSLVLPSAGDYFISKNVIEFKNSLYETYGQDSQKVVLRAKKGYLNLNNQDLKLIGKIKGTFTFGEETFSLKTESLNGNLKDKSISSKEKTVFRTYDLEVVSNSMEIFQTQQEEIRILFRNGEVNKINSSSRINKGKANKIEIFLAEDLLIMKGNVEFYEENSKIISDEIQYDLNKDRILKSLNAKIINNL